jgi:hypothetical protein
MDPPIERLDVLCWLQEALADTCAEDTPLSVNSDAVVHLGYVLRIIRDEWIGPRIELSAWEAWLQDGVWPTTLGYARLGYEQNPRWTRLEDAQLLEDHRHLNELHEAKRRAEQGLLLEDEHTARRLEEQSTSQEKIIKDREHAIAKRDARKRALQAARPILAKREITELKHFVPELLQIFLADFPGPKLKNAAYRFIARFASHVTGEDVKPERVKKIVNRAR